MTGLAGLRGSVRIAMTGGAVLIGEVILAGCRSSGDSFRLVTICAEDRDMRSCQNKLRLGVAGETIRGRRECNLRVTGFAAVRVSCSGELSGVYVGVALRTSGGFQLVFRVFPTGLVALGALHDRVLPFERKQTLLVLFAGV